MAHRARLISLHGSATYEHEDGAQHGKEQPSKAKQHALKKALYTGLFTAGAFLPGTTRAADVFEKPVVPNPMTRTLSASEIGKTSFGAARTWSNERYAGAGERFAKLVPGPFGLSLGVTRTDAKVEEEFVKATGIAPREEYSGPLRYEVYAALSLLDLRQAFGFGAKEGGYWGGAPSGSQHELGGDIASALHQLLHSEAFAGGPEVKERPSIVPWGGFASEVWETYDTAVEMCRGFAWPDPHVLAQDIVRLAGEDPAPMTTGAKTVATVKTAIERLCGLPGTNVGARIVDGFAKSLTNDLEARTPTQVELTKQLLDLVDPSGKMSAAFDPVVIREDGTIALPREGITTHQLQRLASRGLVDRETPATAIMAGSAIGDGYTFIPDAGDTTPDGREIFPAAEGVDALDAYRITRERLDALEASLAKRIEATSDGRIRSHLEFRLENVQLLSTTLAGEAASPAP